MKYERGEFQDDEPVRHSYCSVVIVTAILLGGGLIVAGGLFYESAQRSGTAISDKLSSDAGTKPDERKPLDETTMLKVYEEAKARAGARPTLTRSQIESVANEALAMKGNKQLTSAQLNALIKK